MKRVKCKSGVMGWSGKLHSVYHSFEEFESYCTAYNCHQRLGYSTPKTAWQKNPVIKGSINPSDYSRA